MGTRWNASLSGSWVDILSEIPVHHSAQERQRLRHFLHPVHTVFDADPTTIPVLCQQAQNRGIIVQAFSDDAVFELGRIPQRAVALAQFFNRGTVTQPTVTG